MFFEAACFSVEDVRWASQYPFHRIELCAHYEVGGVTPPMDWVQETLKIATIPIRVMIRPRSGDFHYSENEKAMMLDQIQTFDSFPIDGYVIGGLTDSSQLDLDFLQQVRHKTSKNLTFHRAFDEISNSNEAVRRLSQIGFQTVLTAGRFQSVAARHVKEGKESLIQNQKIFQENGIELLLGGGVDASVIDEMKSYGFQHFHFSVTASDHQGTHKKLQNIFS